ncbi:MAG: alpha/beta hydrolase [Pseudomonadota bacterium]
MRLFSKYVLLPLALMSVGGTLATSYLTSKSKALAGDANWFETPNGIDLSRSVSLGGIDQFVRIRGRDKINPVLLELHGGPGSPTSSLTYRNRRPLTEYFTLVEWDQRGSGRSVGDDSIIDTMSYDRLVDDTIELIEHLQSTLDVEKVILLGHSWGSMLGVGVIQKRPDLVHAYVGVGQALEWPGGFDETKRLLINAARVSGDAKTVQSLEAVPDEWPPQEDVDALLEQISVIQGPLVPYRKSLHASHSGNIFDNELVLDVATSPDSGLFESLNLLELSDATKALIADIYGLDLGEKFGTEFDVPVFIFQGEHDWQTPTTLVKPWFESLSAPQKAHVPFEHSAHFVMNAEPGKYLYELINQVRPLAVDAGEDLVEADQRLDQ